MALRPILVCAFACLVFGCQLTSDQQLIGAWTADRALCQIPNFGDDSHQFENVIYATQLKLSSDHTFILTGLRQLGGKWSYQDGTLTLKPATDAHQWELRIITASRRLKVSPDFSQMRIGIDTPAGEIVIVLDKTA